MSNPHIVTLIANPAKAKIDGTLIMRLSTELAAREVNTLSEGLAVELVTDHRPDRDQIIELIGENRTFDVAVQTWSAARKKSLLLADMDSTMIRQECIDELAAEVGVKDRVSEITRRAMNGEIEFDAALKERVALLKGLPVTVIEKVIANRIELMPGGPELVRTMRKNGAFCALVSGGFTDFTSRIAEIIGFQEHRANRLLQKGGLLTGFVGEPILGKQAKLDALNELTERMGLSNNDVIAVGDGANDLAMIGAAGLGVALHAKPAVGAQADVKIEHGDLTALLYLQGYRDEEILR